MYKSAIGIIVIVGIIVGVPAGIYDSWYNTLIAVTLISMTG